jgi:hypothetical protein
VADEWLRLDSPVGARDDWALAAERARVLEEQLSLERYGTIHDRALEYGHGMEFGL